MNNESLKNAIFSFIIPGLGQILKGDRHKGLAMVGGAIVLHIGIWFFMNNPIGSVINTTYHAYAAYDAYMSTQ